MRCSPLLCACAAFLMFPAYARPAPYAAPMETRGSKAEKKEAAEKRRLERKARTEARQQAAREKKVLNEIARKERLIAARGYGKVKFTEKKPKGQPLFKTLVEDVAWNALGVIKHIKRPQPEPDFLIEFLIGGESAYEFNLKVNLEPAPQPQPSPLYPRLTEIPKLRRKD